MLGTSPRASDSRASRESRQPLIPAGPGANCIQGRSGSDASRSTIASTPHGSRTATSGQSGPHRNTSDAPSRCAISSIVRGASTSSKTLRPPSPPRQHASDQARAARRLPIEPDSTPPSTHIHARRDPPSRPSNASPGSHPVGAATTMRSRRRDASSRSSVRRNIVRPPSSDSSRRATPVPPRAGSTGTKATALTGPCCTRTSVTSVSRARAGRTSGSTGTRRLASRSSTIANGRCSVWRFVQPPSVASITCRPARRSSSNADSSMARSRCSMRSVSTARPPRSGSRSRPPSRDAIRRACSQSQLRKGLVSSAHA